MLHSRFFFITTNLRKGLRPFNQPELELLTDCLARVRERVPVSICAYCVMPDHLHAIPFVREGTTIWDVMMRFKISASRRISSPWQKSCRSEKWQFGAVWGQFGDSSRTVRQ